MFALSKKPCAACTVAVAALRRRPLLGLAAGFAVLAAIRPSTPSVAMRLLQVTPPSKTALNNIWHYRSQSTLSGLFSLSPATSIMASLNPPQPAPKWTHTPEEVLRLAKDAIAEERARLDKIGSLKPEECTFESVRPLRHSTFPFQCSWSNAIIGTVLIRLWCCAVARCS